MIETIIAVGIVGLVALLVVRSFYRTWTGKNDGCGCTGNCHGCSDVTKHNGGTV